MQYCKKCGTRVLVIITDMELPLVINQAAVYVVNNQSLTKSYMPHECYAADPAQSEAEIERLTQFFIGCTFNESFDDSFLLTVPENMNLIMTDEDFFDGDLRKRVTISTWYLLEKLKKACQSLSYAKAMTRLDENVESEKSKRRLTNAREEIISAGIRLLSVLSEIGKDGVPIPPIYECLPDYITEARDTVIGCISIVKCFEEESKDDNMVEDTKRLQQLLRSVHDAMILLKKMHKELDRLGIPNNFLL